MNTLYLTAEEKQLFDALPEGVQDGWQVEIEERTFDDSTERRAARLGLMRLHDPGLRAFQEKARKAETAQEIVDLMEKVDLRSVPDDDMAELFFALGPNLIGRLVAPMLAGAKTDDDVESVAHLLFVRHSLLEAFSSRS